MTWDPNPTRPFKCVGYRISMQEGEKGGGEILRGGGGVICDCGFWVKLIEGKVPS